MIKLTKPLPNNTEAEKAVLGGIIIDGKLIEIVKNILNPNDFYKDRRILIFATMQDMIQQEIPIDILTLSDFLKLKEHNPQDWGGVLYLMHLEEMCPTTVNLEYYAKTVKEYSQRRILTEKLIREVSDLIENKTNIESAITQLSEIDTGSNLGSKIIPISAKELEQCEPVDTLWGNILYPSSITQVNSEPGVGKTTFFYNLCYYAVRGNDFLTISFPNKLKVLYIDVETPHWKRNSKIALITEDESPENLYFLDSLQLTRDFSEFLKLCKMVKYDLVVFDTQSRILDLEQENDNAEANRAMGLLRTLANETGCSIVLIHHTSKSDKKGTYSGRGASAVAAAVDVVVNMEMLEEDVIKLKVDKNRVMGDYQTLFIRKIGEDKFEPFIPPTETSSGFEKFKAQDLILNLASQKSIWTTADLYIEGNKNNFSKATMKRARDNLSQTGKQYKGSYLNN